jgi:phage-related protein
VREIVFYRTESDARPIEDFLDSLPGKQAQKVAWVLRLIEEMDLVPAQYFKKMPGTQDIWEVRVQVGSDTVRLLGFLFGSRVLILTNAFAKKTRKAPPREIALAEQRKRDYLNRSERQWETLKGTLIDGSDATLTLLKALKRAIPISKSVFFLNKHARRRVWLKTK